MIALSRSVLKLQLLQAAAVVLPIIAHPWLAQHLGPSQYGRFVFVTAIAAYLGLICDFGFGWSATRSIAVHRADRQRVSEIVCTTIAAKCVLFLGGLALLASVFAVSATFRAEAALILLAYLGVFGSVLSPSWYFQGIERPQNALFIEILGRATGLLGVVVGVSSENDLALAVGMITTGQVISGLLGIMWMTRTEHIGWRGPEKRQVVATLREGLPLFVSTSAVSLYTAASTVVLGFMSTREQVAFFGAAQKISGAATIVLNPFQQAFYPRISFCFHKEVKEVGGLLRDALKAQGIVGLLMSALLFFFAQPIVNLMFGSNYSHAASVLQTLAALPFVLSLATVASNLVILALGRNVIHMSVTIGAAAVNLAALFVLVPKYGATGAATALVIAELFVLLYGSVMARILFRRILRAAT